MARTAPTPSRILINTVRSTIAKLYYTPIKDALKYQITVNPPVNGRTDFSREQTRLELWNTRPDVTYTVILRAILKQSVTDDTTIIFNTGLYHYWATFFFYHKKK